MMMQSNYQKILVGVDSSVNANRAFFAAVHTAKQNNATLYVVHVINNVAGYLTTEALDQLKEDGLELCHELREQAANLGFTEIEILIEVGSPKQLIAQILPQQLDIDLIVLGATGKHRLQESVLGSVPQFATTNAEANVLIIRPN